MLDNTVHTLLVGDMATEFALGGFQISLARLRGVPFKKVEKYSYRDRESGKDSFDLQPSKMKQI